jgi:hypothetical protein
MPSQDERHQFEAAQAAAVDAARKAESARVSLFEAREGLKRAERAGRSRAVHEGRVKDRTATAQDQIAAFTNSREAFEAFTDPRVGTPMLDDATPFLLFPLRIETRFGTAMEHGVTKAQLWVRVYPDDCLIDSFEPLPSETEIASTQRYWANMWKAHGIEAQERGAWRSFVASHGSGRAAWLEVNYRPLNMGAKPNNPATDRLVLVIPTETPIVNPEAAEVSTFWEAVWLADGKRADIDQATTKLRTKIRNDARAQALIDGYKPINLSDEPPRGLARNQVKVTVAFEGRALEEVVLVRDEVANMVWGVEKTISLPSGRAKPGSEAAAETFSYHRRLLDEWLQTNTTPSNTPAPAAPIVYKVMNSVPENWIPFISVHVPGDVRATQLQRAAMPRLLDGDSHPIPVKVRPRTILLRDGLDATPRSAYFLHEEEVPRAGALVSQAYQRTRWTNGRVVVWLGARKQTGRGEGSSGLTFDRIINAPAGQGSK